MEDRYKTKRIVNGNPKWVIVDEVGKVINKNPTREEIKDIKIWFSPSKGSIGNKKKYTKEYLIECLWESCIENERLPKIDDFTNNPKLPSYITFIRYFGSWNNALKEAGLDLNRITEFTKEGLLEDLLRFEKEYGRPPTIADLTDNPKYPSRATYWRVFGGLEKAKKLVGQDMDTLVRKGILLNEMYKGRLFEIFVMEHFHTDGAIDLSGEDRSSHIDGICPEGKTYDARSTALRCINVVGNKCYTFNLDKNAGYYYLGAFNGDYSELQHVWRVPGDFAYGSINIGIDNSYIYNLENMKQYEITEKFIPIFNNWIDRIRKIGEDKLC